MTENENENKLALFEQNYLPVFKELQEYKKAKAFLEEQEAKAKEELEKAMKEYGIKSIKNDYITISYVEGSTTEVFDINAFKEREPELYQELFDDYKKTKTTKSYVKFIIK